MREEFDFFENNHALSSLDSEFIHRYLALDLRKIMNYTHYLVLKGCSGE